LRIEKADERRAEKAGDLRTEEGSEEGRPGPCREKLIKNNKDMLQLGAFKA